MIPDTKQVEIIEANDLCFFITGEQREKGLLCPTEDAFLMKFLRARKGDYKAAFKSVT
jgi:hypothetical protein